MKEIFKHVKGDKIIKWGLTTVVAILVLEIAWIALFYFSLPPVIPLFNQMPWGESRLGAKPAIFLPTMITLAFLMLNFSLITRLYEKIPLVSRMLCVTTLLIALLSFIFIIKTMSIIL
jgi:hypothetical protein